LSVRGDCDGGAQLGIADALTNYSLVRMARPLVS
jgi:hypothetical protein